MNHAEYLVDLVDEAGTVIGTKKRSQINKGVDLYHTVFVALCTPDHKLILSRIPQRKDLPNLYAQQLGLTAAAIRRHGEASVDAGQRVIRKELGIDNAAPTHIGDCFAKLSNGHKSYMSVYLINHPMPHKFSRIDIEHLLAFSKNELVGAIKTNKDNFAPTLLTIWQKYKNTLLPTL